MAGEVSENLSKEVDPGYYEGELIRLMANFLVNHNIRRLERAVHRLVEDFVKRSYQGLREAF